jgi:GntR family transcriptional regulator, transcriptional repressor for pyruvate dehydrogenase complex
MNLHNFTPIPRQRRSGAVTETLRNQLLCGALKPGDRLPTEATLCRSFGISRTTLREALHSLRSAGVLDITPGRGSYVRRPQVPDVAADLALSATLLGGTEHAGSLLALILQHAAPAACQAPRHEKTQLLNFLITRDATPTHNTAQQLAWQRYLVKLAGNPLLEVLTASLHTLLEAQVLHTFSTDPDAILRAMPQHVRATTALLEGDAPTLTRTLHSWLGGSAPLAHAA